MGLSTHSADERVKRDLQADDPGWLAAFHEGERAALEACYRDHFEGVERAIGTILHGADRETVIHEVFSRLIAHEPLRRSFHGGSLGAWLATVARNAAIDYRRRAARETTASVEAVAGASEAARWEEAAQARLLIERFRREKLPPAWAEIFELCFLQQMSQREAARALGLRRTTLAYRQLRIRRALRRFLLDGDS